MGLDYVIEEFGKGEYCNEEVSVKGYLCIRDFVERVDYEINIWEDVGLCNGFGCL